MYIIIYNVYFVRCTLYSVQCTMYIKHIYFVHTFYIYPRVVYIWVSTAHFDMTFSITEI